MLCPYHKQQTIPLLLLMAIGLGVIVTAFLHLGFHPMMLTLLPGLAFSVFYANCAIRRERKPWHALIWKISIWWSGTWLVVFGLGLFAAVPISPVILSLPAGWALCCGIHPFVAVGLHLVAWGCSLDASRNEILVPAGEI